MVYIGVGGDINGAVDPTLLVHEGETVQINLINGEGAEHDIVIDQYGARSSRVVGKGASSAVTFTASKTGDFFYIVRRPAIAKPACRAEFKSRRAHVRRLWRRPRRSAVIQPTCLRLSVLDRRRSCAPT